MILFLLLWALWKILWSKSATFMVRILLVEFLTKKSGYIVTDAVFQLFRFSCHLFFCPEFELQNDQNSGQNFGENSNYIFSRILWADDFSYFCFDFTVFTYKMMLVHCLWDPTKKDNKRCMFIVQQILSSHDLDEFKWSQMTPNDISYSIRHIESHL